MAYLTGLYSHYTFFLTQIQASGTFIRFFFWLASPTRPAWLDGFPGRSNHSPVFRCAHPSGSHQEISDSSDADKSVMLWFAQLNQKYQPVLTWCWDFQSTFPTSCRQSLDKEEYICAKHGEP